MRNFNQRIATFRNWPYLVDYQPADFADAGFFYLDIGDRIKCFYCNGGLQYWKNDQEPWSEHAKWFPKYVFSVVLIDCFLFSLYIEGTTKLL